MARDSTGKWVTRAGATGGGRSTYRGQMPVNWYATLALIVVLGIASVIFARYEYRNGGSNSSTTPPTVGTTWYAGFVFDICGIQQAPPPSNAATATKAGFFTSGQGVITIKPTTTSQSGTNATLSKFVSAYPGMLLTQSSIRPPGSTVYSNGETCAAGSPDAGKKGQVTVVQWSNALAPHVQPQTVQGNPGDLRFSSNQLITMAFVPAGKSVPRPSGSVVSALLNASTSSQSSSTVVPPTGTPGTTPAPSATTAPIATPTTAPAATTTAPKSSSSTTKP